MSGGDAVPPEGEGRKASKANWIFRLATWLIAAGCFYLVYTRIEAAAAQDGATVLQYLARFFGEANWLAWLGLMVPYSFFFVLVDTNVTWRCIRWFNAPSLKFRNILTIRASAYILSLVNEQVGKGAMSLYLYRRYQVPGWRALSTMLILGLMEIYQLLIFSSVGVFTRFDVVQEASSLLPLDRILPALFSVAAVYLPLHIWYFSGRLLPASQLRNKGLLHAFRQAKPLHYLKIILWKAPNLLGAILVYTFALELFNVSVSLAQTLAFLPVIFLAAALPLPFHAGALLLWTVLFPDYPEVGAFSLVMHSFFVLMNALIGLAFLPRANKELFGSEPNAEADGGR